MAQPQPSPLKHAVSNRGGSRGAGLCQRNSASPGTCHSAEFCADADCQSDRAARCWGEWLGGASWCFRLALLAGMTWIVATQLVDLGEKLPDWKENIVTKIRIAYAQFGRLQPVYGHTCRREPGAAGREPTKPPSRPRRRPEENGPKQLARDRNEGSAAERQTGTGKAR